ncbi:hypothetical protein [Legionella rubrilucens]|uniref:hypothetical protein n=1 Tax=Legionella rubrilucens TaxID=458 RepID=UPI001055C3EC|nr:hypothetical protein [Legionella rubrilucens]
MHTEHFEQLKTTLNNLQKPVQELAALHARTLQNLSYIKPEEFSRMQNPEEIWDRNIKLFIQNSHKALDFMQQAFTIFERHWLLMSDNIKTTTSEALQNGQAIARTLSSGIKSTGNGTSRPKTTAARRSTQSTSASRTTSSTSKTASGKTASASRTTSGVSKSTSAKKSASSASRRSVKKVASKAGSTTSKSARSASGIAKSSSIKKTASAKKPATAKKVTASKAKTTTARTIAKPSTSIKKTATGKSSTASRAKTTARPMTAKSTTSVGSSRPGTSSSLMHGTNGGAKHGIATKPATMAGSTATRPGMQPSKPISSSMASSKDMSKPIINPSATVRDNKTVTSEHNKYGSMNIPSHLSRDSNLPKK